MTDRDSPLEWTLITHSAAETTALGERLGRVAMPGLVIALSGNLGAGKTRFVQGLATGFEIDPAEVCSPTFTLIHEYAGRLMLYHFDVYRLKSTAEYLDLGVDEICDSGGVTVIEWAERVADVLPAERLDVEIQHTGESIRSLKFTARGPQATGLLQKLCISGG